MRPSTSSAPGARNCGTAPASSRRSTSATHGHAPGKQARWAIKQRAALETRDAKDHNPPPPGQQVAAWARKAERSGIGALAALHEAAAAYSAEHEPSRLPSEAERARIIRKAVAAVAGRQRHVSTGRS